MKFNKLFAAAVAATLLAGGSLAAYPQLAGDYSLTASAEIDESEYDIDYTEGTYESLTYRKYAGTDYIEISDCDRTVVDVVIPKEIEGLPVTTIGDGAFFWCKYLKSITIPDSVTKIRRNAFGWCEKLESITIPDSVTTIGNSTFNGCDSLTSIVLPDSITNIGIEAFVGCSNLTSITLSNNLTVIVGGAFRHCESLESITIPESVTSLEFGAFQYCDSLKSITIPESVTSIGDFAFESCKSLESITILNPDCEIDNDEILNYDVGHTICNKYGRNDNDEFYATFDGTIYGWKNSTAQAYAEKYGYDFEVIGEAPAESEYKLGDPNKDGLIDAVDASYILALYAKISTSDETPTEFEWITCDVNGDGFIDAVDASSILAYYAHTSTGGTLSFDEFLKNN